MRSQWEGLHFACPSLLWLRSLKPIAGPSPALFPTGGRRQSRTRQIEARNVDTDAGVFRGLLGTGNFTIAQLPVGTYELSVSVPGFKKYVRTGIIVEVAGIDRIDPVLAVGAATESVAVNAETPLLKPKAPR